MSEREERMIKAAVIVALVAAAAWLGTIAYIAGHFIRKYW